jgi:predicted nuclease with TOPRIM domain
MGLLSYLFGGGLWNNWNVSAKMSVHKHHYPIRDLRKRAVNMLSDEVDIEHIKKDLKSALQRHLRKNYDKDMKKGVTDIHRFIEDVQASLVDEIAITHMILDSLRELIKENEEIKGQLHEADTFLAESEKELQRLRSVAHKAGEALMAE